MIVLIFGSATYIVLTNINNRVAESDQTIEDLRLKMEDILKERETLNLKITENDKYQNASAEQLASYRQEIYRLQTRVDDLSQELRKALSRNPALPKAKKIDGELEESREDIKRLSNSAFRVSVYCYWNISCADTIDGLKKSLFSDLGFRQGDINSWSNTTRTTVFYYADIAKEKADIVAREVSRQTNKTVVPELGAGANVKEEEKPTLIIVWIR
ncbi:hypothetical protein [Thiosocius teredinicola]|uniref:hypothetical protein n=1 Tax=Thiosocius teredinicola TaxID=1973002 RepID=UPI000F7A02CF